MTREEMWHGYACAALAGILADSKTCWGMDQAAGAAAAYADATMREHDRRFPEPTTELVAARIAGEEDPSHA